MYCKIVFYQLSIPHGRRLTACRNDMGHFCLKIPAVSSLRFPLPWRSCSSWTSDWSVHSSRRRTPGTRQRRRSADDDLRTGEVPARLAEMPPAFSDSTLPPRRFHTVRLWNPIAIYHALITIRRLGLYTQNKLPLCVCVSLTNKSTWIFYHESLLQNVVCAIALWSWPWPMTLIYEYDLLWIDQNKLSRSTLPEVIWVRTGHADRFFSCEFDCDLMHDLDNYIGLYSDDSENVLAYQKWTFKVKVFKKFEHYKQRDRQMRPNALPCRIRSW